MTRFSRLAACGLALLQSLVAACGLLYPNGQCSFTRRDLTPEQAQRELGPLLSNTSSIFGPSDPRWLDATERYQLYAVPDIQMVVQPRLESDIPTIVSFTIVAHQLFGVVGNYKKKKKRKKI